MRNNSGRTRSQTNWSNDKIAKKDGFSKLPKAFTMIEMSVVLIIIGILISGVLNASGMIMAAKMATARSITSKSVVPNIEGLVAWYETTMTDSFKASENYEYAQISAWYDISPASIVMRKNTLTRTASSAATYTNKGINNIASINFTGTGTFSLTNFYQGSLARGTIFLVARPSKLSSTLATVVDSAQNSTTTLSFLSSGINLNSGTPQNISNSLTTTQSYIVAAYLNSASSKVYINNSATIAGGSTVNIGSSAIQGLMVGNNHSGGYPFAGIISEIIIYDRPLKDIDRKEIFRYLSNKYKIPVQGL